MLLREAHEVPQIHEAPLVVSCEGVEHGDPCLADAERVLQQIHELLRRERAGKEHERRREGERLIRLKFWLGGVCSKHVSAARASIIHREILFAHKTNLFDAAAVFG